ncbi:MAG: putative outer membrane repeat protein [Candidatus Krumholzibacteriia bacterium]|jgi:predicted outer membrane repeat protein
MIKARAGDIILVSCGTYKEYDILVKPGVSLWSGTLQPDCVTIDAGGRGRCLVLSSADSTTSIVGITFVGGRSIGSEDNQGGAILCEDSAARFTRCSFRNNSAISGGAVAVIGSQGPQFESCDFTDNEAQVGGAIVWRASSGDFSKCTFASNSAESSGGAIATTAGRLDIFDSLFSSNESGNSGGAVSLTATESQIEDSIFFANQGGIAGGAVASAQSEVSFRQCTFHANDTDGHATIFSSQDSNPVFDHCLFTGSANPMFTGDSSAYLITRTNILPLDGEPWPAIISELAGTAGNLALDPLFCAPETGDLHLRDNSPCLPSSNSQQIGALTKGCGAHFP